MTIGTTSKENNAAYDASATWLNAVANALNALINVSWQTVTIPMNQNHATVTHNLGIEDVTPANFGVVFMPTDDVGRCWYDMNTVTGDAVTIYVANPPLEQGGYNINFILYWK